jgi:hypothetical protein
MAFKRLYTHPLHPTWLGMMQRCGNPKATSYKDYGGRGIRVCDAWKDEATFIHDIETTLGKKPGRWWTLDRIDNSGHYEPGNVRWSTSTRQVAGRRNSIQVVLDGEVLALRTACLKHLGLTMSDYNGIFKNLRSGVDFEKVMGWHQVSPLRIRLHVLPEKRKYQVAA